MAAKALNGPDGCKKIDTDLENISVPTSGQPQTHYCSWWGLSRVETRPQSRISLCLPIVNSPVILKDSNYEASFILARQGRKL